jgi:hypothetical protein
MCTYDMKTKLIMILFSNVDVDIFYVNLLKIYMV